MGEYISIVANVCGILGFFISIFTASKVIKLSNSIKIGDKNSQLAFGKNKQKINTGDKKQPKRIWIQ